MDGDGPSRLSGVRPSARSDHRTIEVPKNESGDPGRITPNRITRSIDHRGPRQKLRTPRIVCELRLFGDDFHLGLRRDVAVDPDRHGELAERLQRILQLDLALV